MKGVTPGDGLAQPQADLRPHRVWLLPCGPKGPGSREPMGEGRVLVWGGELGGSGKISWELSLGAPML